MSCSALTLNGWMDIRWVTLILTIRMKSSICWQWKKLTQYSRALLSLATSWHIREIESFAKCKCVTRKWDPFFSWRMYASQSLHEITKLSVSFKEIIITNVNTDTGQEVTGPWGNFHCKQILKIQPRFNAANSIIQSIYDQILHIMYKGNMDLGLDWIKRCLISIGIPIVEIRWL